MPAYTVLYLRVRAHTRVLLFYTIRPVNLHRSEFTDSMNKHDRSFLSTVSIYDTERHT